MDLLKDDLGKLYRKFLIASFGSALIASIYGLVDMIVVGQYHGPDGSAAMSVIAPVWNIIYSFGLLTGIGGSVLYGVSKGKGSKKANLYFTSAVVFSAIISAVLWVIIFVFEDKLLLLFGANEKLMPLCKEYMIAPKFTVPIYVCINLFSSFLRNDSDPGLATKSVIAGGVFNIFGDYFCVFTLDMGIRGAGIATAMGAGISTLVMLTHFFKKSNTLRLQFSKDIFRLFGRITVNGFSSFIIDVAMGVLTMLFNRQIMKYLGTDALAVYGVIVSVSTLVQCCSYGIGQASQPIISQNYGAGNVGRIKKMLRYNIITAAIFGAVWAAITFAVPNGLIRLFMTPTASVLAIAPGDNPNIRLVVPAAAVQCLFNLLFPGDDACENLDVRVRRARNTYQRRADTHYPRHPRRGYDLVGDARDRACCRRVCRRDDVEENPAVILRESGCCLWLYESIHRLPCRGCFASLKVISKGE